MTINRHNYEEYFILYMDNELSSDERRMVELFIANNTDLKDELDILMQYKMEPDSNIVFEGKEELLKVGGETPINLSNYEEWLVLYMDNEMTAEQRIAMEQFIAANPSIQKEADLLLRTQLQPETIVFANKEVLYRKEEKEKVRPVLWWRVAAAVLILVLGTTAVILLNNNKAGVGKPEIAKAPGTEQIDKKENAVADNNEQKNNSPIKEEVRQTQQPVISDNIPNEIATANSVTNKTVPKKNNADKNVKLNEIIQQAPIKNKEELANNNKKSNNLPQPIENRNGVNNNQSDNAVAKNDVPKESTNATKTSLTTPPVTKQDTPPSDIIWAGGPNTKGEELEQPGKKGKLRGFFRKVTRTFEKRTNIDPTEDDEKLLLGGLAIRLK